MLMISVRTCTRSYPALHPLLVLLPTSRVGLYDWVRQLAKAAQAARIRLCSSTPAPHASTTMFAPRDVRSYVCFFPKRFEGKPEAAHSFLGYVFYNPTHGFSGMSGLSVRHRRNRKNARMLIIDNRRLKRKCAKTLPACSLVCWTLCGVHQNELCSRDSAFD